MLYLLISDHCSKLQSELYAISKGLLLGGPHTQGNPWKAIFRSGISNACGWTKRSREILDFGILGFAVLFRSVHMGLILACSVHLCL